MEKNIIVAVATPFGKSGIGVVRMSGNGCLSLATQMFRPFKKNVTFSPNLMVLGDIDLGGVFDKGFLVYFKAPHSYTGEDVVEFQCHGGIVVLQKIIEKALSLGCRMATNGEFSKRAFLNGKMSLDEAEGVMDIINSESEGEMRCSSSLMRGELYKKVTDMQGEILDIISDVEVNLDYPEMDIEYETIENVKQRLNKVNNDIKLLLSSAHRGKILKHGIDVAIVGRPNVGKSSLLNKLLGYDKAIVTDIAGTTRDIVTGSIDYKGVRINFLDTAGVRDTEDKVERIGVEKSRQTIDESDIVLLILDSSEKLTDIDKTLLDKIKDKHSIIVLNKSDLDSKIDYNGEYISISVKDDKNIETLKDKIYNLVMSMSHTSSNFILTNIRHIDILKMASEKIDNIVSASVPIDCIALDIREVWEKLGEITGETLSESIIDHIFSKFCLGK